MSIVILLSTYNGEKFLREQIESLLSQSVHADICVRDDGSHDGTRHILCEYARRGLLSWYAGRNIGPGKSFFDLSLHAPDADFYSFADQDDVWDRDKLETAVHALRPLRPNVPALYCGAVRPVDAELNPLAVPSPQHTELTFARALAEPLTQGCTFVFNARAMKDFRRFKASNIDIHDWALYRIVTALGGSVIYDTTPHMSYRQHSGNAIGMLPHGPKKFLFRLERFLTGKSKNARSDFARHIWESYCCKMSAENRELIELITNYRKSLHGRARLAFSGEITRSSRADAIMFAILALIGWV